MLMSTINELTNHPCFIPVDLKFFLLICLLQSSKYMTEFVKEYGREARIRQTARVEQGLITDFPAYVVVFLIHLLAHDKEFPLEECQDETLCARFCRYVYSQYRVSHSL